MIFTVIDKTFAKPIAVWAKRIAIALLILWTVLPTGVMRAPMQVTDATDGEWHGVTVHPAIVAASKVPQGVIAQIDLTINIPAEHEWAVERIGNGVDSGSNSRILNRMVRGENDTTAMDAETSLADKGDIGFKTYDFVSRGGGWFTTLGEIQFNRWSVPLTIQALEGGGFNVLTSEPDVSFTVKGAVAVKPKPQLKWSAEYLYGTNGTHTIIAGKDIFPFLSAKAGVEFGGNTVNGKVGLEVRG